MEKLQFQPLQQGGSPSFHTRYLETLQHVTSNTAAADTMPPRFSFPDPNASTTAATATTTLAFPSQQQQQQQQQKSSSSTLGKWDAWVNHLGVNVILVWVLAFVTLLFVNPPFVQKPSTVSEKEDGSDRDFYALEARPVSVWKVVAVTSGFAAVVALVCFVQNVRAARTPSSTTPPAPAPSRPYPHHRGMSAR